MQVNNKISIGSSIQEEREAVNDWMATSGSPTNGQTITYWGGPDERLLENFIKQQPSTSAHPNQSMIMKTNHSGFLTLLGGGASMQQVSTIVECLTMGAIPWVTFVLSTIISLSVSSVAWHSSVSHGSQWRHCPCWTCKMSSSVPNTARSAHAIRRRSHQGID